MPSHRLNFRRIAPVPFSLTAARYSIYAPVASFVVYLATSLLGYYTEANAAQIIQLAYTNFYGAGILNLTGFTFGMIGLCGGIRRKARGIRLRSFYGLALNGIVLTAWFYLMAAEA